MIYLKTGKKQKIQSLFKMENLLDSIIDYFEPKAHDAIDKVINAWEASKQTPSVLKGIPPEHLDLIQGLVMGIGGGGGAAKGVRQLLLAMKGKIKGGKMIPSQPFRQGMIGKPTKTAKQSKLDILLNKLKDNPNIGENINRVMHENIKKHKPKK